MSTTADKAVALHYANGRGTVVEIDVGRIQIGGDVSILSMVRTTSPALLPLPLHGQHHPAPLALGVPLQGCALQRGPCCSCRWCCCKGMPCKEACEKDFGSLGKPYTFYRPS
jgi:hypothetical protein